MMTHNRYALRLSPTTIHALRSALVPSSTFKKGNAVDTVLLPILDWS